MTSDDLEHILAVGSIAVGVCAIIIYATFVIIASLEVRRRRRNGWQRRYGWDDRHRGR